MRIVRNSQLRTVGWAYLFLMMSVVVQASDVPPQPESSSQTSSVIRSAGERTWRFMGQAYDYLFVRCRPSEFSIPMVQSKPYAVADGVHVGSKLGYRGGSIDRFSAIDCEGGLSILLDPKGPEGRVRALSDDVMYSDSGDVLYIKGNRGTGDYDVVVSGERLVAQISAAYLHDQCALSGENLKQANWRLVSDTTGNVVLRGKFGHFSLLQSRENVVDVYWLDSHDVDVVSRSGVLRLAGEAKQSRIRTLGDSQLLVSHLRTKNGWLHASGSSFVEMFGSKRLAVYTSGSAQVQADGVPMLVNELSDDYSMFVLDDRPS